MADERRVYVEDPRFAGGRKNDREPAPVTVVYNDAPNRGCLRSCFSGCLMFAGLLFIVQCVLLFIAARNWRQVVSFVGAETVKASFDQIELPEAEQAEIDVQIDRVSEAFREGRISPDQAGAVIQRIIASPLATSIIVAAVDAKYLTGSGLSEDELVEGRKTLARFARGVLDHRLPDAQRDATLRMLATRNVDGSWELKPSVPDAELRAFLAAARANADAAQIPEQPEIVDPSEEMRKIIDEALGEDPAIGGFLPAEGELRGAAP